MEDNIPEQELITQEIVEPTKETRSNQSRILIIGNVVVLCALIVLYVLYFVHQSKQHRVEKASIAAAYTKPGGLKIAFVNSDTIKAHYELVKQLQKNLETKYSQYDAEIAGKQKALEQRSRDLQQKFEAKQMSMDEAQRMDEQLKAEGQKLYQLNQDYTNRMSDEEMRLNIVFVDSIHNFLKRYNSGLGFDYILGYSKGGGILLAKDTLDITSAVLEGLNKEYKEKTGSAK